MSFSSKRPKSAIRNNSTHPRHGDRDRRVSFRSSSPSLNNIQNFGDHCVYVEEVTFDPLDAPDVILDATRRRIHSFKLDPRLLQQARTDHSATSSASGYTGYQTPRGYGDSSTPSSTSSSKYQEPSRMQSQSTREGTSATMQRGGVSSSSTYATTPSSSSSSTNYGQQYFAASQSTTDIPQQSSTPRSSVYQMSQLERELYAPVEGTKNSSGSKAKREVYRLDKHISSSIVPKFTPRELASTKSGAKILTEIAEMQKEERINQLMASQIASVKYARSISSGYQSSLKSNTRGHSQEERALPSYSKQLHSRSGGKSRRLPSFVSSNGKEYTIRSSGSRQYAHHKHER